MLPSARLRRSAAALCLGFSALVMTGVAIASAADGGAPGQPGRLGMCEACHGADGRSRAAGTPHLAGQDEAYLRDALRQYRRAHAAMRAIIQAVPEAELAGLAAWYAAQPAGSKSE